MFGRRDDPEYAPLEKSDSPTEDGRAGCAHCECAAATAARARKRSRVQVISLAANVVLCLVLVAVLFTRLGHDSTWNANTSGTDFAPSEHLIKYETVRFSGTAAFDENGTAYRVTNPDELQYVGEPTPEIDEAWDALISGRNFYITEEEAKAAWGESYTDYYMDEHGIRAELDVLHTLHCVNKIRQALSPDYYFLSPSSSFNRYHFDHCIDIIRQSVQCSGDLTLIPTKWFPGANRRFIDSDQKHTCRNFQSIRDWTTERHNGTSAIFQIGVSTDAH